MFMHRNFCPMLVVLLLILRIDATLADAPTPQPAPFLISLHIANTPGHDYLDLDNPNSSFDITLKNVSSVPQTITDRLFIPFGVEITAINGTNLSAPVGLGDRRGFMTSAFSLQIKTLQPGEELAKRIFVVNLQARYNVTPHQDPRLVDGPILPRLAGANSSRFETVTLCAVYMTWQSGSRIAGTNSYQMLTQELVSVPVTVKTGL